MLTSRAFTNALANKSCLDYKSLSTTIISQKSRLAVENGSFALILGLMGLGLYYIPYEYLRQTGAKYYHETYNIYPSRNVVLNHWNATRKRAAL